MDDLNSGKYLLVIGTQNRRDLGTYSIKFSGIETISQKVTFERLKVNKADWGMGRGAVNNYSLKNHVYTFEVTADKSNIDYEIHSSDADIYFELYNLLGQRVNDNFYGTGMCVEAIEETTKGKYTLMVATAKRDTKGAYSFNIFGNIYNLQKVESQSKIIEDTWPR
ncbi:hypothetical protein [Emticicia sp. TH156]|uniref:hypothetical protein n=1 Tax=Emticicia sp. TH156 TaxID=2067454 RepID=UPI000C78268D|nr:hypothetical protein [Emticicia sp. TH156]